MRDMQKGLGDMPKDGGAPGGRFQSMTYCSSTQIGPDGKPVTKTYQTKARGATDAKGKQIAER